MTLDNMKHFRDVHRSKSWKISILDQEGGWSLKIKEKFQGHSFPFQEVSMLGLAWHARKGDPSVSL